MDLLLSLPHIYLLAYTLAFLSIGTLLLQQVRIRSLERELDTVTLHFQKGVSRPKQLRDELFAACPYPLFFVDREGTIRFANPAFKALSSTPSPSLAAFDAQTGADLQRLPLAGKGHTHRLITLRREGSPLLRQFTVLAWPVWGQHAQEGSVVSFHEQTHVIRRKAYQLHFEEQLLSYLAFVAIHLSEDPSTQEKYSKELHLLASYTQRLHRQVRQPNPHGPFDVIKVCRELLNDHRAELRTRRIQLTTSLPGEVQILGHRADIDLALRTLLEAVMTHAGTGSVLRFSAQTSHRRVQIEFILPEQSLSEKEIEKALDFGAHDLRLASSTRLRRLQLALVQELVGKYNGHLSLTSHSQFGTAYRLTLVVAAE